MLLKLRASHIAGRRREHTSKTGADFDKNFVFDSKLAQSAELNNVEAAYENVLLSQVSFPKANTVNYEVEDWVDQVMSNWSILVDSGWEDENLEKGGKAALSRRVLAVSPRSSAVRTQ